MKLSLSLPESVALLSFLVVGGMLRMLLLDLEAVEHFDEGIYASPLWYDGQFGEPYPARYLFAPPLLSGMMEGINLIPGLGRFAPFLPSVLLGTATILGLWWIARSWFGKPAGAFIAAVVAMNDFHILYSRMALTDVACLFWIVIATGLGVRAVSHQCLKSAIAAGFVCGLAWWTKYTGWLPLAIVCSGSGLWWIWQGRKSLRLTKFIQILATISIVALATFAPWWLQLQSVGGYHAVSETHASYVTGWSSWSKNLAQQLHVQFLLDGFTGQLSLGLGLFAAGIVRWTCGRSTWNVSSGRQCPATTAVPASQPLSFPPMKLLLRFIGAAIAISVLSFRIWAPLMLICLTLAGLTGIFLWPVLQRSWLRRRMNDLSPTSPGAIPLSSTDLECAPTSDPTLGLCTTLTWFVGMLLATPMYSPFSRLFFPLMASVWLASAAGVAWWLESNLSVARRIVGTGEAPAKRNWGQQLVSTMLVVALITSFFRFDENLDPGLITREEIFRSSLFEDRRSIVLAADDIAHACENDVSDTTDSGATNFRHVDLNYITPAALLAVEDAKSSSSRRVPGGVVKQTLPGKDNLRKMILYVYGEPALLLHLNNSGVIAAPVSHLNLRGPGNRPPSVPTFLVFGPNAKRTYGFWEDLMRRSEHLRPVSTITYAPSLVTLLDMFDPKWLKDHPEAEVQTFEVHRVE